MGIENVLELSCCPKKESPTIHQDERCAIREIVGPMLEQAFKKVSLFSESSIVKVA